MKYSLEVVAVVVVEAVVPDSKVAAAVEFEAD